MKHYHKLVVLVAFFLLSLPLRVSAQEYKVHLSQIDTSEYPEITVYVNVVDENGEDNKDMAVGDFAVWEDGEGAEIVDFVGVGGDRPVDIVFVFDATGSMRDEIDGLKQTAIEFADHLRENNRDFRLGLVSFGDEVKQRFHDDGSLTADEQLFRAWVSGLGADGGGDDPENAFGAIKAALEMQFRPEAQLVFILITDAPPHRYDDYPDEGVVFEDPDLTISRVLDLLESRAVTVFPVAPADADFRELATKTGGSFHDINGSPDFTSIIDDLGGTIASQYKLTYLSPRPNLDGTMRRIEIAVNTNEGVASKSSGEYLEAHLLNIQSSWLIGLILLFPLILGLVVPSLFRSSEPSAVSGGKRLPAPFRSAKGGWSADAAQSRTTVSYPQTPSTPRQWGAASNRFCFHCGAPNRPGAKFCQQCRQQLPSLKETSCPYCQGSIRAMAHFCPTCGHKLTN